MNIQSSIYYFPCSNVGFQSNKKQKINYYKTQKYAYKQPSPIEDGAKTAFAWFGFGVVLDAISRKFRFFKSPFKNSLFMNSVIGLGAGFATGFKTFVNQKNDEE